ncbi:MAG TPA: transposase [Xanthobacteraceae bacterium]|nr:transposase [Xanthobacteraceae bacterium]
MNILPRDKQIQIIAALTEGMSIRAVERLTGIHRDTIMRLGAKVGRGCAELHDRMVVGIRTNRLELDELWAYIGRRRRQQEKPKHGDPRGDTYTYVALSASTRAIVTYRTGKRDSATTDEFIQDLRQRVIGAPEISTDGYLPYQNAIRDAFRGKAAHGQIVKTYSVTNLVTKEAARRYSPAEVIAVEREVVSGLPAYISTSLVERSHLTMRMQCRRFARLTNAFSKTWPNHAAAVSLHIAFYNFVRVHETIRSTPAQALGITDHAWSIGELIDAALATQPITPVTSPPERRKRFQVIEGGKLD